MTNVATLPVVEIQSQDGQLYVTVDGKQWARFDGPTGYENAARCCATIVVAEIKKLS